MENVTITIINDDINYKVSLGNCSKMDYQEFLGIIQDVLHPFKHYDQLVINDTKINPKTFENDLLIFLGQN